MKAKTMTRARPTPARTRTKSKAKLSAPVVDLRFVLLKRGDGLVVDPRLCARGLHAWGHWVAREDGMVDEVTGVNARCLCESGDGVEEQRVVAMKAKGGVG